MFKTKLVSSMEKGFLDSDIAAFPTYKRCRALRGMQTSFQLFTTETEAFVRRTRFMDLCFSGDLLPYMQVRSVENIPSALAVYPGEFDDNYLRTAPGLYPDLLRELHYHGQLIVSSSQLRALWFDITVPADAPLSAGEHTLTVEVLYEGEVQAEQTFTVDLVDAVLPESDFRVTQWFHPDCLADYYRVPIYSERHWEIMENFIRTAVKNGITLLLTPVFTLALDTEIGGERPTTQLVDVTVEKGQYRFGYERFDRWVEMCQRAGVRYFEISHLFTQWGAAHAPKVMATVDGEYRRIFGWDTDAHGAEYGAFLDAFLPDFVAHVKSLGIDKLCYYHISDEPHTEHIENYTHAKQMISKHLQGYTIIDALSSYAYYEQGLVQSPVVASNRIENFLGKGIEDLWVYYCCGQNLGVSNRLFSMPGWRTRYMGVQMYYYDVKGFLQWGYNFYYTRLSIDLINPFADSTGEYFVPSGDTYSVYPADDGTALESMRLLQFREGLEDMMLCRMAEQKCGRAAVLDAIEECCGKVVFGDCIRCAKPLLALRERLFAMI